MALYEIVLTYPDCETSFFSDRRPVVGETLQLGLEMWYVAFEDESEFRQVVARFLCRSAAQ
jgi:hypothetical protein